MSVVEPTVKISLSPSLIDAYQLILTNPVLKCFVTETIDSEYLYIRESVFPCKVKLEMLIKKGLASRI